MQQFLVYVVVFCRCLGQAAELQSPASSLSTSSPLPPLTSPLPLSNNSSHSGQDGNLESTIPPHQDVTQPPKCSKNDTLPSPPPTEPTLTSEDEDQQTINKTLEKYGFSRDYKLLDLPGPEILVDDNRFSLDLAILNGTATDHTLKIRTIVNNSFSYNVRYEEVKLKRVNGIEILAAKGQFGEHFERKSGGFYVLTIGYTLDEKGYQQFLIDLSKAETIRTSISYFIIPPGGPGQNKDAISSTVLASLIGGNSLG